MRHLAWSVFPSGYRRNIPAAMFTAYFDAAGTKRKAVLTVAGFVSRVNKWARFEREWRAILDAYEIRHFHMTDFASSANEFNSWRGQTARRRELIERLALC